MPKSLNDVTSAPTSTTIPTTIKTRISPDLTGQNKSVGFFNSKNAYLASEFLNVGETNSWFAEQQSALDRIQSQCKTLFTPLGMYTQIDCLRDILSDPKCIYPEVFDYYFNHLPVVNVPHIKLTPSYVIQDAQVVFLVSAVSSYKELGEPDANGKTKRVKRYSFSGTFFIRNKISTGDYEYHVVPLVTRKQHDFLASKGKFNGHADYEAFFAMNDDIELSKAFNIHDTLTAQIKTFVNDYKGYLDTLIQSYEKFVDKEYKTAQTEEDGKNSVLSMCEKHPITKALINMLSTIETSNCNIIAQDAITHLINLLSKNPRLTHLYNVLTITNETVLLHQTIGELTGSHGSNITNYDPVAPNVYKHMVNKPFTAEQLRFVTNQSQITVTTAGAGSGKSTALLGRVHYLMESGVKPETIMVLSFTNTAADHIKESLPGIHSMTIAQAIKSIYSSFYNHQLVPSVNILTELRILQKRHLASKKPILSDVELNVVVQLTQAFDSISELQFKSPDYQRFSSIVRNLLSTDPKVVINILNELNMTTLEMQQLITYQILINNPSVIPADFHGIEFLLVDECQDSSTFEIITLLTLSSTIESDIAFVGDINQTLYEFRNANPRIMPTLMENKFVETFSFDINFRSNEQILTVANVILDNLETNAVSLINLKTPQFTGNATSDEMIAAFNKKIKLVTATVPKDRIRAENIMHTDKVYESITDYVTKIKTNHPDDTIGILTLRGAEADTIQQTLVADKIVDELDIDTLISDRKAPSTLVGHAVSTLMSSQSNLDDLTKCANVRDFVILLDNNLRSQIIARFNASPNVFIPKYYVNAVNMLQTVINPNIPRNQWLGIATKYLTTAESIYNATSMYNKKEQKVPKPNAKVFTSTIHSAKGLEFDHVVLVTINKRVYDQASLRAIGVALTRAKVDELLVDITLENASNTHQSKETSLAKDPVKLAHKLALKSLRA